MEDFKNELLYKLPHLNCSEDPNHLNNIFFNVYCSQFQSSFSPKKLLVKGTNNLQPIGNRRHL